MRTSIAFSCFMWAASSGQRLQIHHSKPSSALAISWSALCVVTSMVRNQVLNFVQSYVASFLSASYLNPKPSLTAES